MMGQMKNSSMVTHAICDIDYLYPAITELPADRYEHNTAGDTE